MGKRRDRIKRYLDEHKTQREVALFMFYGTFALIAELLVRFILDIVLKRWDYMLVIWPFPEQAAGSFVAFLVSNLLAKTISYIFNRKKTFKANNNAVTSGIMYAALCIALLIIETIIGTPLQNGLYRLFGGGFCDEDFSTISATAPGLYQLCGTLSQLIYCAADSLIMFFVNKFLIMRRVEKAPEKEKKQ